MTLSPMVHRRTVSTKKKSVTWNDAHHKAVNDLLNEASQLIQIFDQVSMLLGPNLNLPPAPSKVDLQRPILPSMYTEMAQQDAEELKRQLENFKPKVFEPPPELGDEYQRYLNQD